VARQTHAWLSHFPGYFPLLLPFAERDSLKTKALVAVSEAAKEAAFSAFSRQILQMFTGN
jgi:hypothetical protein